MITTTTTITTTIPFMEDLPPQASPLPLSPPPPPPQPKSQESTPRTYKVTASKICYTKPITTSIPLLAFLFKQCTKTTTKTPQTTYILQNITLTAYPAQILAIVGPSGAGKSTLLDILSARVSPSSGTLLLNNTPITSPSSYRKLSSFVPQHDSSSLSLPLLTVSESFAFAASLLNPNNPNSSYAHIDATIVSLLSDLKITHLSNTPLSHSLSGGERRRVSIGLSLLRDPAILVLDEPTTGLDSGSAYSVVEIIKGIAESRRRTVVMSVHQPSVRVLECLERIVVMEKGRVKYNGKVEDMAGYLGEKGFEVPRQLNVLEYAMEVLVELETVEEEEVEMVEEETVTVGVGEGGDEGVGYRSSRVREIGILFSRSWKIIYRTKQLLLTNVLEALGVGLVLGTIYINVGYDRQGIQKRLGLFAFTLTFLLSSTTETLPIFINERPVLLRETTSGLYRLSSFLIANTLVFLPYLLMIALIYSVSVYFLVGLCASWQAFAYFVLVIWIIVLMANSFVLFLSSLAPNYIAGTSLVTVLLGAFFLFSGYFISKDSMPRYWIFMHFLSMYKYALDALLINEYSCLTSRCLIWYPGNGSCMVTGRDVMVKRGLHEGMRWINVYVLIGFFVLYRVLCLLVLLRRISRLKK